MVRLAITPDARWQATPAELIAVASTVGFDALGLSGASIDEHTPAVMEAADLRCHEVLALVLGADEHVTLEAAEQLADAASLVGADWVLTVFRADLDAATSRTVRRCAELFAAAGAAMGVEFSPFGPAVSLSKGREIVDLANRGAGRAGLVIDSWHFFHTDSTWLDLTSMPVEQIAYVQFTDALAPDSGDLMHETMDRRALPGDGVLALRRFADTLLERGWDGTVSAEVLSAELCVLPLELIASRLHASLADFWLG